MSVLCPRTNHFLDALLRASPHIAHTAIFGSGRFMNGAIFEPSAPLVPYTPETVSAYLDTVWPHITGHVNPILPQHSRLVRSLVLVAKPDKAMMRTDKGTVKVKLTLAMYDEAATRICFASNDIRICRRSTTACLHSLTIFWSVSRCDGQRPHPHHAHTDDTTRSPGSAHSVHLSLTIQSAPSVSMSITMRFPTPESLTRKR